MVCGEVHRKKKVGLTCSFQEKESWSKISLQEMLSWSEVRFIRKGKIVSEYDQEIPQSQTADNPVAPRGRAAQPSRDTRKTN